MIEVAETEQVQEDSVSFLPSTSIDVEDFDDQTKDRRDLSDHVGDSNEPSTYQGSAMVYTVDSSCSLEDEPVSIDSEYCSDEDEPELSSPTSSTKMKPNYHRHPKPPFSYIALIAMAIKDSPSGKLTLAEINEYLMKRYPFFRGSYTGWRNSVRHNLSLNECFTKILRDPSRPWGKDNFWTINENSDYTFADGVFRRRRKRINRNTQIDSRKFRLHGTQHQQPKGKFTGPFSIDSILGNTNIDDNDMRTTEHFDSSPSSQSDIYPHDYRIPLVISPHDSMFHHYSIKSRSKSALHEYLKTFQSQISPSSSSAIERLEQYRGLTGCYFELETLQYSTLVKPEVSSTVVPLTPKPLETGFDEYRAQLPWRRPVMPVRPHLYLAPPATLARRSAHAPKGFLVENLIAR